MRRGERNHGVLGGAAPLGLARTLPAWTLLDLGPFPALVAGGTTAVAGELYAVAPGGWPALDALEECPAVFRRETIDLADGRQAQVYRLPAELGEGAPAIPGGDWVARPPRPAPAGRLPCFAEVWAKLPWRAVPGCPGRFVHAGGLGVLPEDLLGATLPPAVRSPACADPVLVVPFPGGGLLAYQRRAGWVLTLNDGPGLARKRAQLGV